MFDDFLVIYGSSWFMYLKGNKIRKEWFWIFILICGWFYVDFLLVRFVLILIRVGIFIVMEFLCLFRSLFWLVMVLKVFEGFFFGEEKLVLESSNIWNCFFILN